MLRMSPAEIDPNPPIIRGTRLWQQTRNGPSPISSIQSSTGSAENSSSSLVSGGSVAGAVVDGPEVARLGSCLLPAVADGSCLLADADGSCLVVAAEVTVETWKRAAVIWKEPAEQPTSFLLLILGSRPIMLEIGPGKLK